MTSVAIIGGGPAGYEAALVARAAGAHVQLVSDGGIGGSAVLTDVVPSKGLISVGEVLTRFRESSRLGISSEPLPEADLGAVNERLLRLAAAQSHDIKHKLIEAGVEIIFGRGSLAAAGRVLVAGVREFSADVVLIATGARPRVLPTSLPDGERILTWQQLYQLAELPRRLVVVGSGVTGAEFASAYQALGADVVLVSSRPHVLPGEDQDAAAVLESVFAKRGIEVVSEARAASVRRVGDDVEVELADGRIVRGSHCLLAVGSVPQTEGLGLAEAGVVTDDRGFIQVNRVSRTSALGVYAAGDCTGVLPLASVAAMQGRIAMHHALGSAVTPLDLGQVSANVFTDPEIATVGVSQRAIDAGEVEAEVVLLPLATNARAKLAEIEDGFVKLFCQPSSRMVLGGVVVAPRASELIHSIALAVSNRLTVADLAATFTVYPSLTGSIAEAARQLRRD